MTDFLRKAYYTIELIGRIAYMLAKRNARAFISPQNKGAFIVSDDTQTIFLQVGHRLES